jgi:hypothetical protein
MRQIQASNHPANEHGKTRDDRCIQTETRLNDLADVFTWPIALSGRIDWFLGASAMFRSLNSFKGFDDFRAQPFIRLYELCVNF